MTAEDTGNVAGTCESHVTEATGRQSACQPTQLAAPAGSSDAEYTTDDSEHGTLCTAGAPNLFCASLMLISSQVHTLRWPQRGHREGSLLMALVDRDPCVGAHVSLTASLVCEICGKPLDGQSCSSALAPASTSTCQSPPAPVRRPDDDDGQCLGANMSLRN